MNFRQVVLFLSVLIQKQLFVALFLDTFYRLAFQYLLFLRKNKAYESLYTTDVA